MASVKSAKPKSSKPSGSKKAAAPSVTPGKPTSKKDMVQRLADKTGLGKQDAAAFYDAFVDLFTEELGKKGPGVINIPGLLRAKVVKKPATKARNSVNPFTKEPMTIAAKPARKAIKLQASKGLKDALLG